MFVCIGFPLFFVFCYLFMYILFSRERADMFSDSLFKLDKYREALSSKKRHRSEISPNERLGGGNLSKMGSQIHRNGHDVFIHRLEDRAKSVGLNKRARSSISDVQVCNMSISSLLIIFFLLFRVLIFNMRIWGLILILLVINCLLT